MICTIPRHPLWSIPTLFPYSGCTNSARNAIAALVKRLSHRNPNVQIYALELANTLAQNCGKPLQEELASRTWTGALERILNDRVRVVSRR